MKPQRQILKYILPAYWASYLINGDSSGLMPIEKAQCDAFLARENITASGFVSCGDETYSHENDAGNGIAGNVCEYSYLKELPQSPYWKIISSQTDYWVFERTPDERCSLRFDDLVSGTVEERKEKALAFLAILNSQNKI